MGWGDWWGGLVYAGIVRACFVQQATFCVNSLAHWIGEQPFDDRRSPRDHVLTALVTMGEGYHNFHHEFPSDYRKSLHHHFPIPSPNKYKPSTDMSHRKRNNMVPIRPDKMAHLRPLPPTPNLPNPLPQNLPHQRNRKRPPAATPKSPRQSPLNTRLGDSLVSTPCARLGRVQS